MIRLREGERLRDAFYWTKHTEHGKIRCIVFVLESLDLIRGVWNEQTSRDAGQANPPAAK
jgi:hypothetical protein